ncbi:MAG TPA: hypothetical protein VGU66_08090 [Candidatus Elarobacter sp.]|nr:hypothetical protein [Candidatus Elarobacter sp.]
MSEIKKVLASVATFVALFAMFAFAPPRDPAKVVPGIPCSVLSENDIGAVLGTPMRLMPTSGSICQYVSTTSGAPSLFVVARRDPRTPAEPDTVPIAGLGGTAVHYANTLYVRYGTHAYTFAVVPQLTPDAHAFGKELQLARLLHRATIAQNR